jgi:hypothetical protein
MPVCAPLGGCCTQRALAGRPPPVARSPLGCSRPGQRNRSDFHRITEPQSPAKRCGSAAPAGAAMPQRSKVAQAPHAAAAAASKIEKTLKSAKKTIQKSRQAKLDSKVALAKAEKQESAAKKKLDAAKAEQDTVLNAALAHYRREHVTNGKGPKHSVTWFANQYSCSYFRLWRAVSEGRSVAAVKRGRPVPSAAVMTIYSLLLLALGTSSIQ